jgi:hypothetical protein
MEGDPRELDLVKEAITARVSGCCDWDPDAVERVNRDPELAHCGLTPRLIKELLMDRPAISIPGTKPGGIPYTARATGSSGFQDFLHQRKSFLPSSSIEASGKCVDAMCCRRSERQIPGSRDRSSMRIPHIVVIRWPLSH